MRARRDNSGVPMTLKVINKLAQNLEECSAILSLVT